MHTLFNLKSFFKFLSKNSAYTFIDIFGFSVSLMFVILIAVYTKQELSVDRFHEKADRIYVYTNEEGPGTAYRIGDRLRERYPDIENVCAVTSQFKGHVVQIADKNINADLLLADTTLFTMFDFPLVQGQKSNVMETLNYAVISESFLHKAFPDEDPMGKVIRINDGLSVTVNGVMKDIKNSTIPPCDIVIRMDNVKHFNNGMDHPEFHNAGGTALFFLIRPGADIQAKTDDVIDFFKDIFWLYRDGLYSQVHFIPLKDFYFSGYSGNGWTGVLIGGDYIFVLALMSMGILILIFAIINYINLTVAQTGFRAKEMATRRLLGSGRWELFVRLMLESSLLTFVSFIIAILGASFFAPYASGLLERTLDLKSFVSPYTVLLAFGLIVLVGMVAGLIPATLISNAKPVDVVKGAFRTQTKMVFSKIFITFQNLITISLIALAILVVWQTQHLIHAPLGYPTQGRILIDMGDLSQETVGTLRNEFENIGSVKAVACSQSSPFKGGNNLTTNYNGTSIGFQRFVVDPVFVEMYDIQILRENNLTANTGLYLSERALLEMGEDMDIEYVTTSHDFFCFPVAGIIKDFILYNITISPRPVTMDIRKAEDFEWGIWTLTVQTEGDPWAAYEQVKQVYERITHQDFTGEFIERQISETFAPQKRLSKIVFLFAVIAVIISLLGLLAMSTYFVQQRKREIAVRKVFGSTNREILVKLVANFLNFVGIAFLLAIPVIWYLGSSFLGQYTYSISFSPLIFIAAGLICLVISFFTVYWQSFMAARENPANSVKAE